STPMPAGVRDRLGRIRRAMAEHKLTTTVFGGSGAAILALGIFAGVSSPGAAGTDSGAAASAGSAGSSSGGTSSAQDITGKQAPAFKLASLTASSAPVSLADYAGRPVLG